MGLFKYLGFTKRETCSNYRAWTARPFYGVAAFMCKHPQTGWSVIVTVDDNKLDTRAETFKTRSEACYFVWKFGSGKVTLKNAMSGKSFVTTRDTAGRSGICPSMESYHCM